MNAKEKNRKGRTKMRWLDTIENDLRTIGVCVEYVKNRDEWRIRTMVAYPNSCEKVKIVVAKFPLKNVQKIVVCSLTYNTICLLPAR
jgi:hypothetical protein